MTDAGVAVQRRAIQSGSPSPVRTGRRAASGSEASRARCIRRPHRPWCFAVAFAISVTAFTLVVPGFMVGSASVAGAASPKTERYLRRADAICEHAVRETDRVVESRGYEGRAAVNRIVAIGRREVRRLRTLTPPRGDARRTARIYDAMADAFHRIDAHPGVIDDEPGPFLRATRLAKSYGLAVCGRG